MIRLIVIFMLFIVPFTQAGTHSAAAAPLSAGPIGYTFCVNQGGVCSFGGTGGVAFGANGLFNYKVAGGSIECTTTIFKDPAPGVAKACYYKIVPQSGTRQRTYFTSYGYNDNDDGNGNYGTAAIAFPSKYHEIATEGKGTYTSPITFATDRREIPPHTMIYVPYLQKYFFMEDGCVECAADWNNGKWRTDLFMGPNDALQPEPALADCESKITRHAAMYINAGPGYPVDTRPLFSNGKCTARLH